MGHASAAPTEVEPSSRAEVTGHQAVAPRSWHRRCCCDRPIQVARRLAMELALQLSRSPATETNLTLSALTRSSPIPDQRRRIPADAGCTIWRRPWPSRAAVGTARAHHACCQGFAVRSSGPWTVAFIEKQPQHLTPPELWPIRVILAAGDVLGPDSAHRGGAHSIENPLPNREIDRSGAKYI